MKRIVCCLLLIACCYAVPAGADAVDEGLLANADAGLKTHTRSAVAAGVDGDRLVHMTRSMLAHQYQVEQIVQAQKSIMAAVQQGLPAEPVMNKAHEGMAKKASPEQVLQAMEQVRGRYGSAYGKAAALGLAASVQHQVGNLTAEALTAGMKQEQADRIMQQLQSRTHAMSRAEAGRLSIQTMTTARDMARMGVKADLAADVVCQALQNRFQVMQMQQLREQFHARSKTTDPHALAHQFSNSFQHGRNPVGSNMNSNQFGHGEPAGPDGSGGYGSGPGGAENDNGSGSDGSGSGAGQDGGSGGSNGGSGDSGGGSGGSGDSGAGSGDGSGNGSGGSGGGSGSGGNH